MHRSACSNHGACMGANRGGGGGGEGWGQGDMFPPPPPPTILKVHGAGHNNYQMSPPLFLGWMIINWNEDPFYMFSDVVDLFFLLVRKVPPTLCLENWAKYVESKRKSVGVPPPPPRGAPPAHPLISFLWTCATFEGGGLFFLHFFVACQKGLWCWCTMGTPPTPTMCLENLTKKCWVEKETVSEPPPPPPPPGAAMKQFDDTYNLYFIYN